RTHESPRHPAARHPRQRDHLVRARRPRAARRTPGSSPLGRPARTARARPRPTLGGSPARRQGGVARPGPPAPRRRPAVDPRPLPPPQAEGARMLIDSPRLTPRDRDHWARLEHFDDALSHDPDLDRLEARGRAAVEQFAQGGDWYVSVSWGKDSVAAAHIALQVNPRAVLRWARARHVEMPECEAVRDAFLRMHPEARYEEIEYVFRVPLRFEPGHDTAPSQDELHVTLTGSYVSRLRAHEPSMRRNCIGHRGLVTSTTCRPIAHWDATHVFAYLHKHDLPVHPAYAMSMGGYYDRRWLRVHPLGTAAPPASAVYRRDHAAWEELYYGDVLKTAQAARAHMWKQEIPCPEISAASPVLQGGVRPSLERSAPLFDGLADDLQGCAAAGCGEVGRRPQVSVHDVPVHVAGELLAQKSGRDAFEAVHQL